MGDQLEASQASRDRAGVTASPTLSGKTLFITGASRGIGEAIALRAAQDGANIVIAAKTAEPHPKLPGTIYSAAEAVTAAGGQALPLVVDIRFEDQVQAAVQKLEQELGRAPEIVVGTSIVFPGRHRRLDNLTSRGREVAMVVIGAVALFFIAALIEGFFRQLVHDTTVRWLVAGGSLAVWSVYIVLSGRSR